jgi:hypothetical protein
MTTRSVLRSFLVTGALLMAPLVAGGQALAHGSMKPQHGGQVALAGEVVVELVQTPRAVSIYLTDEDEPLAASDYTGKLVVNAGAKKRDVALKAGAGNRLDAAGLKVTRGTKIMVSLVTKSNQARSMASFTAK